MTTSRMTGGAKESLRRRVEGYKRILELDRETLGALAKLPLAKQLQILKGLFAAHNDPELIRRVEQIIGAYELSK